MLRVSQERRADQESARARQLIEMRLVRAEKRKENKARWANSPDNANIRHALAVETIVAAIADPTSVDIRSIDRLREIMHDKTAPLGRRVEAGEVVLGFELPAAALARQSGDPITSGAYLFLKAVANTPGAPEALKFRALKALSQVETAKPGKADPNEDTARREMVVAVVNADRRLKLIERNDWPPGDDSWRLRLDDVDGFDADALQRLILTESASHS